MTSPLKEQLVSTPERRGTEPSREPPKDRWKYYVKRVRGEAGVYLVRGAATAAGGACASYGILWIQSHF